jgi:hypothetical protein
MNIIVAWLATCVPQQGGPKRRNGRIDAATPPAETSISSGATPSVWKEESVVLMRSRDWLARGSRGITEGEHHIVKVSQDEASPAALCRKTPEAQDFLLAERECVLRRHLSEDNDVGCVHPCDGRVKAVTAIGELTKSAEEKNNSSSRLGSIPCPELLELGFNLPHFATL